MPQRGRCQALGEAEILGGVAEQELGTTERFRNKQKIRPVGGLSYDWLDAANDGSLEFALALGLASIYDPEQKIGPLRANLGLSAASRCHTSLQSGQHRASRRAKFQIGNVL